MLRQVIEAEMNSNDDRSVERIKDAFDLIVTTIKGLRGIQAATLVLPMSTDSHAKVEGIIEGYDSAIRFLTGERHED